MPRALRSASRGESIADELHRVNCTCVAEVRASVHRPFGFGSRQSSMPPIRAARTKRPRSAGARRTRRKPADRVRHEPEQGDPTPEHAQHTPEHAQHTPEQVQHPPEQVQHPSEQVQRPPEQRKARPNAKLPRNALARRRLQKEDALKDTRPEPPFGWLGPRSCSLYSSSGSTGSTGFVGVFGFLLAGTSRFSCFFERFELMRSAEDDT